MIINYIDQVFQYLDTQLYQSNIHFVGINFILTYLFKNYQKTYLFTFYIIFCIKCIKEKLNAFILIIRMQIPTDKS